MLCLKLAVIRRSSNWMMLAIRLSDLLSAALDGLRDSMSSRHTFWRRSTMTDTAAIKKDLKVENLVIVGSKNGAGSDPVVVYTNEFKGKPYFHIRTVYTDDHGTWC